MRQREIDIDVGVQQKLATADNAEIDALRSLADEVGEHLLSRKLAGRVCTAVEDRLIWSPEHLKEQRLFTAVMTATFRSMST